MKTLHITNAWSETSGGIATFYRALMDAANRRRQKMVLVVPAEADSEKQVGEHVRLYEIAAPKAKLNSVYRTIYPSQFFTAGAGLRKILEREEPDVVEINDKYTLNYLGPLLRLGLLPEIKFRPVVVGLTCERMDVNFQTYLRAGAAGRAFCSWYMRYVYFPFFDHHIAVSDETAEELRPASKGHKIARAVFQLPMGVDCRLFSRSHRSTFERARLLRKIEAGDGAVILLYVGRLAPEKNLSLLLETMEHLARADRDYRLVVAGDGISRTSFLADAEKRLGRRVSWLGYIADREALAKLYANSDFFLHPNPREPFGIAPLEAMASGMVLVAPNSGGVKAYANSSNAALSDASGSAFASAIEALVRDEQKRNELVHAAMRTAGEFSWEAVTNQFLDLYQSLKDASDQRAPIQELAPRFISETPSPLRSATMTTAASIAATIFAMCSRIPLRRRTAADHGNPEGRNPIVGSVEI